MKSQTLETILETVSAGDAQVDVNDPIEARELFLKAKADCARAGIASGFLAWRLAVVFEMIEDHEMAFKYAQEALSLDPLAPPFRSSFASVTRAMRRAVVEVKGEPDWVPRFYDLLVRAGESTDDVHLAMARWHLAKGEPAQALKLVNAVAALSPACREAWSLRAVLCRSLGDEQAAREAEIEAAAIPRGALAPFGMPTAAA